MLDRIADKAPPGSGKVIFTPWLYGERTPLADRFVRSAFFNVSLQTKREHLVPSTAHAAFDKAAQYFRLKLVRVPVDGDYKADVAATRETITENTIAIAGSAPSFPHGIIDPIEELSGLARERGIGFHTDACLGGFVLPWAEKLGCDVPPFDFRLPGVTSVSADTHKYG